MGVATTELDYVLIANQQVDVPHFQPKAATDANVPCVLSDLEVKEEQGQKGLMERILNKGEAKLILKPEDGENAVSENPFDLVFSPIKEAKGWADAPADAKEMTVLFANGLVRRPSLILKNEDGVYDHVAVYKSKKDTEPLFVLPKNVLVTDIIDESVKGDDKVMANRSMRLLEIDEDGNRLKIWSSGALEINNDTLWHPHSLYKKVAENVGHPKLFGILGGANKVLLEDCMLASWEAVLDWNAKALNYLVEAEDYDVVFSQVHSVDAMGHMIVKFMKDKGNSRLTEAEYAAIMEAMCVQADDYVGKFLHLLDKEWTILLISDHAQTCPEHTPHMIGDMSGVNVRVMQQLGYTALKKDENGNELYEIDWENTRAIQNRGNHIYLNLKGRGVHGIVDPADQYELEEQIMTDLYGLRDEKTRVRELLHWRCVTEMPFC